MLESPDHDELIGAAMICVLQNSSQPFCDSRLRRYRANQRAGSIHRWFRKSILSRAFDLTQCGNIAELPEKGSSDVDIEPRTDEFGALLRGAKFSK
jgi:hypothetical protein